MKSLYFRRLQLQHIPKILFVLSHLILVFLIPILGKSQVSTLPENKNFLIEKGTGHVCGSCPLLDSKCDSVLMTHPGRGALILYHFGPDAVPQAPPVDKDFTTPFGDTIYDPQKLGWPFYLNMMMNRRDQGLPYGSTFIFGVTNQVQAEADIVVTQPSPVNLWMSSTFNPSNRLLTVQVEAYYTASSATAMNYIQIVLTEDSIVATQYDPAYAPNNHFNLSFVHRNVFRDNLIPYPGDTVTTTTTGSMISRTYTYTVPSMYKNVPCNPAHCNLTFYITEEKTPSGVQSFTGKIQTVIRTEMGSSTVGITSALSQNQPTLYPNPTNGIVSIRGIELGNTRITVSDIHGKLLLSYSDFEAEIAKLDLGQLPVGLYMITVATSNSVTTHKIEVFH